MGSEEFAARSSALRRGSGRRSFTARSAHDLAHGLGVCALSRPPYNAQRPDKSSGRCTRDQFPPTPARRYAKRSPPRAGASERPQPAARLGRERHGRQEQASGARWASPLSRASPVVRRPGRQWSRRGAALPSGRNRLAMPGILGVVPGVSEGASRAITASRPQGSYSGTAVASCPKELGKVGTDEVGALGSAGRAREGEQPKGGDDGTRVEQGADELRPHRDEPPGRARPASGRADRAERARRTGADEAELQRHEARIEQLEGELTGRAAPRAPASSFAAAVKRAAELTEMTGTAHYVARTRQEGGKLGPWKVERWGSTPLASNGRKRSAATSPRGVKGKSWSEQWKGHRATSPSPAQRTPAERERMIDGLRRGGFR